MSTLRALSPLLASRDFLLLMAAQFLAQAADGLAQAAFADRLLLQPEGTPGRILAVFALTLLPYSVIAPFTGVLIDRWRRRSLLLWSNVARFALLVTVPLWSRAFPGDTALYVGVLALLGLGRLFLTTKGAALPVLLHDHHLLRGNAVSGGGGMISALIGGVIGVGVSVIAPTEVAFVIAGGVYATSALVARLISDPMAHPQPRMRVMAEVVELTRELLEGVREIWRRPRARLPLFSIFVLRTSAMVVAIAAILVIKESFAAGDARLGSGAVALGAAGIGAFLGAVFAPRLGFGLGKSGLLLLGFAVSGVGMLLTGAVLALWSIVALSLVAGFGAFVAKVAVDASVQEALPDAYRGRAFSLYDILYNFASVAAALLMVAFVDIALEARLMTAGFLVLVLAWIIGRAMRAEGMFRAAGEPATSV